jgi:hypothetical protein
VPYPDFSDQVYELLHIARALLASLPFPSPGTELVWVIPHDTAPESAPFGAQMETLFGIPAEVADVDRPSLTIRPVRAPEPGPHFIKPPMSHVMRDYDRGADSIYGREL